MDIKYFEPLKTIIDLTIDKKETILFFLKPQMKNKLLNYDLITDKKFYINDNIFCIKKNNLKNEYNGKIKNIIKDKLCVKVNNYYVSINPDHYYIFVKPDTSKKNDRQFFESLLKIL